MKNLIYFSAFLLVVSITYSCGPCPDCNDVAQDEITLLPKDAIPVAQYNTWVTNWKTDGQSYTANTLTEYYTLPLIDITEFMQNPGTGRDSVIAARFVLGMEFKAPDTIPHIMLVGVNSLGESLTDPNKGQYIYDVSKPCPTMCGSNSLPDKN